jgi:hypothetical protein
MFKNKLQALALSALLAGSALYATNAHATNVQWVRNLTIAAVSDTDGYIQVQIVRSGTIDWLSMPVSSSTNPAVAQAAARFLSSATSAWLAGKKLDVKVDFDLNGCGTTQSNCEGVQGWFVHN